MKKLVAVLFTVLTLVACKQPPLEEIASAEAALQAAREAQAPEYAAETYAAAQGKLETAYANVEDQEYDIGRSNAISARELAEAAAREARKRAAEEEAMRRKETVARAEKGEFEPEIQESIQEESLTGIGVSTTKMPPVYFDFDSYTVRTDQTGVVDSAVAWLADHSELRIRLEGHTDERGEAEYNLALGRRRALAIKDELIAAGVSTDRIETVSLGEEAPQDFGHTEEAWSMNRRVEFMLLRPNETLPTN